MKRLFSGNTAKHNPPRIDVGSVDCEIGYRVERVQGSAYDVLAVVGGMNLLDNITVACAEHIDLAPFNEGIRIDALDKHNGPIRVFGGHTVPTYRHSDVGVVEG